MEQEVFPRGAGAKGTTQLGHNAVTVGLVDGRTHVGTVSDPDIRRMIGRKSPVEELRAHAVGHGMRTLLQDGVEKCLTGATDLKQVLAVCSR